MQRVTIYAMQGNTRIVTGGVASTTLAEGSFPGCTVSVFTTGTSNLATIFGDNLNPPTPKSNPFTADSTGSGFFYAANGTRVDIQLSGTGIVTPFTLAGDVLLDDFSLTTISPPSTVAFSATPQFDLSLADWFKITLTGNVTAPTFPNANSGAVLILTVIQDGTGNHTWTWPISFTDPPAIASAAGARTEMTFKYDGANWTMLAATGDNLQVPGNAAIVGNTVMTGTLGVTGALTAAAAKNIGNIQYAAQFSGGSTTCGIAEAYAALPAAGGLIILQQGNCSAAGWPVTIQKPVVIEGQGMGGPNDAGTNANVIAGSSLTNTSTGGSFFVISLTGGGAGVGLSLDGVTLRDFAMIGNKTVVGATAGDCVDINGGGSSSQIRATNLINLQCNQPKGSGIVIKDNVFMVNLRGVNIDQSGSHCMVIKDGVNSGVNSQIRIFQSTFDLCGGSNASFSPGTADGLNISGSTSREVNIQQSTFADSNNGIVVVAGAINVNVFSMQNDYETNTTCDVSLNDGFDHVFIANIFRGTGTGARGMCTAMPAGAATQPNQLLMFGNNFSGHTVQDVTIGANQKTGFILPQSANNYTYSDASGHVIKMDVNQFGALSITAAEVQPAANGVTSSGDPAAAWSSVYTFNASLSEQAAPAGAATKGVLYADSGDHMVKYNPNNQGEQHVPMVCALTSAYTNATTGFTSLTLSPALPTLVAGKTYTINCQLTWQGSATTTGPKFQITGPAAPTAVAINAESAITATTSFMGSAVAFSSPIANTGTITNAVNFPASVYGSIINGANAGAIVLQAAANGAGTLTIQPGSYCIVQ